MHIDYELPIESAAFDAAWIRACASRLACLDALLDAADAECVAAEMSQHEHWRRMRPGLAAASVMFEAADVRRAADGCAGASPPAR